MPVVPAPELALRDCGSNHIIQARDALCVKEQKEQLIQFRVTSGVGRFGDPVPSIQLVKSISNRTVMEMTPTSGPSPSSLAADTLDVRPPCQGRPTVRCAGQGNRLRHVNIEDCYPPSRGTRWPEPQRFCLPEHGRVPTEVRRPQDSQCGCQVRVPEPFLDFRGGLPAKPDLKACDLARTALEGILPTTLRKICKWSTAGLMQALLNSVID